MLKPRNVVAAVLVLLVLTLVIQNREIVAVQLLFWEFEMSRVILILLATLTGMVCGYVVGRITTR